MACLKVRLFTRRTRSAEGPVEKESPSQSEQSIAGRGEYSSRAKLPANPMRQARRIGADLSNLVLQGALNKMEKIH
jgi:hypothetical protein